MKTNFAHTVRHLIIVTLSAAFIFLSLFFINQKYHPSDFRLIRTLAGIEEYEFQKNGLRILLMEDHSAPVITTLVTYLAGQGQEGGYPKEVAHLLEHMVMKSTQNYNRAKGMTAANALQGVGAMMNATTERDQTSYYETFPSEHVEMALDIEADRMRNALFLPDEVERERDVVRNELESLSNSQANRLSDMIWRVAFKEHPYRYAVIGMPSKVSKIRPEDLERFYHQYYWPNNAYLTIIGDFSKKDILNLIKRKFSSIPKSSVTIQSSIKPEPAQTKPRLVRLLTSESDERVVLAFKTPPASHTDSYALDLLAKILTQGKKSRFFQLLVDQKVSLGTGIDFPTTKDPGLFMMSAQVAPEMSHRTIAALILKALDEIKTRGVSESELSRAKKQTKSEMVFAKDGSFSIANYVNQAIGIGDWTILPAYLERIERVSGADIQKAAQTYFTKENLTVGFLKSTQVKHRKTPQIQWPDFYTQSQSVKPAQTTHEKKANNAAVRGDQKTLSARVNIIEKNKMKIFSLATSFQDGVYLDGSFEGAGRAFSDNYLLAGMTAALLDQGSLRHSKYELAEALEDLGAGISFSVDYKRLRFRIRALKEDAPAVIHIFFEMLTEPMFPDNELQTIQSQWAESIKGKLSDPLQLGYGEFKRSLYPASHPNYEPAPYDQLEQLNRIAVGDVKKFYADHYKFQNFKIVAAGDVDSSVIDAISNELNGLIPGEVMVSYKGETKPMPVREQKIFLPGKKSIEIFIGHTLSLHQQDKDYPAVLLANHILGGNFSARLLTRVREEKGLTYSIHSQFAGISDDLEGHWVTDLIAVPEFADQAIQATKKEIALFVQGGAAQDEFLRNQKTLIGNHVVGLSETGGSARQILASEELGLGAAYLDHFPQLIQALSLEEVNQAARNYFKPAQMSTVMAGEYKKD